MMLFVEGQRRCEWCEQPTTELTYLQKDGNDKHIHRRCYAVMYNYARSFQAIKELLNQPDILEIQTAAPATKATSFDEGESR